MKVSYKDTDREREIEERHTDRERERRDTQTEKETRDTQTVRDSVEDRGICVTEGEHLFNK